MDLLEHEQAFVLVADLPGMTQEDFNISVQDNVLALVPSDVESVCVLNLSRFYIKNTSFRDKPHSKMPNATAGT